MSPPGQKICRHCVHAVWQMSPSGKTIRRNYAGRCDAAMRLVAEMDREPMPCVKLSASVIAIWPENNAKTCPKYERKVPA